MATKEPNRVTAYEDVNGELHKELWEAIQANLRHKCKSDPDLLKAVNHLLEENDRELIDQLQALFKAKAAVGITSPSEPYHEQDSHGF